MQGEGQNEEAHITITIDSTHQNIPQPALSSHTQNSPLNTTKKTTCECQAFFQPSTRHGLFEPKNGLRDAQLHLILSRFRFPSFISDH